MLDPHVGRHRIGHLVTVVVSLDEWRRRDAEMRVHVDQAGRNPLALRIDHACVGRRGDITTYCRDTPIDDQHVAAFETCPGASQHRRATNNVGATGAGLYVDGYG